MSGKSMALIGAAALVLACAGVANAQPAPAPATQNAWANSLMLDHRARQAGDIVTVQIVENIVATGSADANLDKSSKAGGALPWPLPSKWSKALESNTETEFKGGGTTSRTASITATMSARVTERRPNGDLAIVGVREIVINRDKQQVTLSGVVRAADIAKGNIVSSAMIEDLRIQYVGRGFMKDNMTPGWLIRILNKIF